MDSFNFYNPTQIFFGEDAIQNLAENIREYNKILLAYGGGSIKKNGIYDAVIKILNEENKSVFELSGITPNPKLDKVYEGIEICKNNNIDFILAVGGGSTIDCSKAIAMGAKTEEDVWGFYTEGKECKNALPLGTVLTLSATGTEMNAYSVITDPKTHERPTGSSVYSYPKFSILDPTYTYSLPKEQTVYGVVDILTHIFEQYFSTPDESNISDSLSEAIIKTVIENSEIALNDPTDYSARANLMWR